MKDGFLKIAAVTPDLRVADCEYNSQQIIKHIREADEKGVMLCAFPMLSITGATCGDLFFQKSLTDNAMKCLKNILYETKDCRTISVVGLPVAYKGAVYNCGAVICGDELLKLVAEQNVTDSRYFSAVPKDDIWITANMFNDIYILESEPVVFHSEDISEFSFMVEVGNDLFHSKSNKANIIVNIAANNNIVGSTEYVDTMIKAKSAGNICTYLYANAGNGESTTDFVFAGNSKIADNGKIVSELDKYSNGMIIYDCDLQKLQTERIRRGIKTHIDTTDKIYYLTNLNKPLDKLPDTVLTTRISASPFIPENTEERKKRCSEISMIQAHGLAKRLKHTNCKSAVIGLSGGLDSTLALIVTVNAFKILGLDTSGITAVTMPCFGTTDRTYNNACELAKCYGTVLREINIKESVAKHFEDIGHDMNNHDVTYENSQARERTQILMDIANQCNGMVIGTGDLSELALGWATYNGDHMSMYGVNADIPKTLVRHLVRFEAEKSDRKLKDILFDILDTPVSPELLPPDENGTISQKTEDLVGPYELHDFFLYYILRYGFSPKKIYRMAVIAFDGSYDAQTILRWEKTFYRRFFTQQFKRSCLPDGPKVGSVSLSPRGDFRMPSDACANLWLKELEEI